VSVGNGHFEHRKAKGLAIFNATRYAYTLRTSGSDRAARLARTPAAASSPNLKMAWVAT
jgi:hypothetical protein